jgi:hypothetical protein
MTTYLPVRTVHGIFGMAGNRKHTYTACTKYYWQLALTSQTSGGRSVGIVRLRTQAVEFSLVNKNRMMTRNFEMISDLFKLDKVDA